MLKFKNIDPCEKAVKMLTWDKVSFEDGYEKKYPVKKVVLTIEAGSFAELSVERYTSFPEGDIKDPLYASLNLSNGYTKPSIFTNCYTVELPETPIEITVSGPKPEQKTWEKQHKERLKEIIKSANKKNKELLKKKQKPS